MRVERKFTIDLCCGMLFILMMNTHALTTAALTREHWLFSEFWLPNSWVTVVFVVLSGYGVRFIYSVRLAGRERTAAILHRAAAILPAEFASNALFAVLRQIPAGDTISIGTSQL